MRTHKNCQKDILVEICRLDSIAKNFKEYSKFFGFLKAKELGFHVKEVEVKEWKK